MRDTHITIFRDAGFWMADFGQSSTRAEAQAVAPYGGTVVPTPFAGTVPAERVASALQRLNPNDLIRVRW